MTEVAPTSPLLEIHNLTVRFGGLTAINELRLQITEGEIFALVGPNGAGKTTVLNCISGLIKPAAGRIQFAGQELLSLSAHKRAALGIGRTFQQLQLFDSMTVLDNLLTAQHTRLRAGILSGILPFGLSKREDASARQHAMETLELLGLDSYAQRSAGSLPFGVQKLIGVARALVLQPRLVLLDEPAAGVPPQEVQELATRLRFWQKELGTTLLLIEHNMRLVQAVADRVCVLDYGSKLAEGEPRTVLSDPAVLEAYLGRAASKKIQQEQTSQGASHVEG
ncbi:ABC transporter ATP-binding protein [Dictyobacter formicarum]|uniref:ABC transporter ATP-binding protein n=1 Tax=Dictyobacter formicarum TaxID=2778368 RepID=A0ABQ3VRS1_9CHLR|nr:ABC transporter ATP-binding protein [Dictyobacter formicarum]GHO88416.1 ABC transporter ATP-binding protein [Dictyobacter formicarum]